MKAILLFYVSFILVPIQTAIDECLSEMYRMEAEDSYRSIAAKMGTLTSRIEEYIVKEMVLKEGYCENPVARRYALYDLDGDREDDLCLVSTFSPPMGGNWEGSYLFVALSSTPEEVQMLELGGRGTRMAKGFSESGRGIDFYVWAIMDAECCPSLSSTDKIEYESGKVRLLSYEEAKR